MSTLRNRVQLIGHLGAAPELKTFENGGKVANLRMATTESYRNQQGEWKEETTWHNVTAWDAIADRAMKYLQKGSFVMVEGKLSNRSYVDAAGVKKFYTEVRAANFLMLDKKREDGAMATTNDAAYQPAEEDDGGLPF
ncbi:MAG: single-stranded DNA-binding protein [Edaphocola sp.]